jgi:allantoin racemase
MSKTHNHSDPPIRIRWVNPIGFNAYDAAFADLLGKIRQPDTEVEVVSFDMPNSPSHLEYRTYEALMVERIVAIARDSAVHGFDAMAIGCFYEPALEDAREISGATIVVAPCEASLTVVSSLANRFSILVGRHKWIEQFQSRVDHFGMTRRLASFRSLDMGVNEFQADHCVTRDRMIEEARRAVKEDHAEAIILGCTCEFGFFEEIQREVGVPVIDVVVATFKQAEHLARLKREFGWSPSRVWSCEPPPEEELSKFGLFQKPPTLNRIKV